MTARRATIVGSSGGAALKGALACLAVAGRIPRLLVITDRDCGLRHWALGELHGAVRLEYDSAEGFSARVLLEMERAGSGDALLFYTRRVAAPLVGGVRVHNIHPSLLPMFPGLRGVADAFRAGAPSLGATLHEVDEGLDTGPIVSQVSCPMPGDLPAALHLSYLQKVWLTMLWFERLEHATRDHATREHATLRDPALLAAFSDFAAQSAPLAPA